MAIGLLLSTISLSRPCISQIINGTKHTQPAPPCTDCATNRFACSTNTPPLNIWVEFMHGANGLRRQHM
jgi:hypothetical protein